MGQMTNSAPYNIDASTKKKIAEALFPQSDYEDVGTWRTYEPTPFSMEELTTAVESQKTKKAPGPDHIPPEAVKIAMSVAPNILLNVMNDLLKTQKFPDKWKIARLVLILKKGKQVTDPAAYRPICLLNAFSKLYERLVCNRLQKELENGEGLANTQYGFRKGRSTIHAVKALMDMRWNSQEKWMAMITLDIRNAFNSASWYLIIEELRRRDISPYLINIVRSYFCGRKLVIEQDEELPITMGVPQGSVLGPTLWNILYDGVLRIDLIRGARTLAYADDLALVVHANDKNELNFAANESLRRIDVWMRQNHLQIAPEKTEALIMKGPRDRNGICLKIRNANIKVSRKITYLGITLDDLNSFGPHVKSVAIKAEERAAKLTRIMPNIGGPKDKKREVLYGVVQSILLYGAPVWLQAMNVASYRKRFESVQRKMLLRIASGYVTTSGSAIQVITGTPPLHLLARERKMIHDSEIEYLPEAKKRAREATIETWQQEWNGNEEKGQWTKRLIPRVKPWMECSHRKLEYYSTQVLTGHGSFRSYTFKIKKAINDKCIYCGERDTPEHTVFHCARWEQQRTSAQQELEENITPDNMTAIMCSSETAWRTVQYMLKKIMEGKEREEREHQARHPERGEQPELLII